MTNLLSQKLKYNSNVLYLLIQKVFRGSRAVCTVDLIQNTLKLGDWSHMSLFWNHRDGVKTTTEVVPPRSRCARILRYSATTDFLLYGRHHYRGGSKGGAPGTRPRCLNSFTFMQFSVKRIGRHTRFGSWCPPGNPGSAIALLFTLDGSLTRLRTVCWCIRY